MPVYEVQAPNGRTFEIEGSRPPTRGELLSMQARGVFGPMSPDARAIAESNAPPTAAQLARQQGNEDMGHYLAQTIRNIPRDVLEQAVGAVQLLATIGGATGEMGQNIGGVAREVVGLNPNYPTSTPNMDALKRMPAAVVQHYMQYLDPDQRALLVREHPAGMALDVAGVTSAARAAATGVKAAGSAVASSPAAKAVGTAAINLKTGGLFGKLKALKQVADVIQEATAKAETAAPVEAPAPAATPASVAPVEASASPPAAPAPPAGSYPPRSTPTPPVASSAGTPRPPDTPTAPPPIPVLKGETLNLPPSARTKGQMSEAWVGNDLGLVAKRLRVTLSEAQFQEADAIVRAGKSPIDAVLEVQQRHGLTPAAAPAPAAAAPAPTTDPALPVGKDELLVYRALRNQGKTHAAAMKAIEAQRALTQKFGTPSVSDVEARVQRRLSKSNRTADEQ